MKACEKCPFRVDCLKRGNRCPVVEFLLHMTADNLVDVDQAEAPFLVLALQRIGELFNYEYFKEAKITSSGGSTHLAHWLSRNKDINEIKIEDAESFRLHYSFYFED